ncbi:hypothetical protein HYR99_16205 [Candidatus Poribacteria bacterium]|nr:hypothetical protein [Candidatus Poribacteria bacterium]
MAQVIMTPDGRIIHPAMRDFANLNLRPMRLYRMTKPGESAMPPQGQSQPTPHRAPAGASGRRSGLHPVPSGHSLRVVSPPEDALVTSQLARELGQVLEQFAQTSGFNQENPLTVLFGRGTMGLHRFHRAADIYAVGGKGVGQWMQEWNTAMRQAAATQNPQEGAKLVAEERARNLGYKLYKALQAHGGWAQPQGYPVQLFGPWTRSEGPHKAISDRLLYMHRDHIHIAK